MDDPTVMGPKRKSCDILPVIVVVFVTILAGFVGYKTERTIRPLFDEQPKVEVVKPTIESGHIEVIVKKETESTFHVRTKDGVSILFHFSIQGKNATINDHEFRRNLRDLVDDYTVEEFVKKDWRMKFSTLYLKDCKFMNYRLPHDVAAQYDRREGAKRTLEIAKARMDHLKLKAEAKAFGMELKDKESEMKHQLYLNELRRKRTAEVYEAETRRKVKEILEKNKNK